MTRCSAARPTRAQICRSRPTARSISTISTRRSRAPGGRWSRSSRSTTRPACIQPLDRDRRRGCARRAGCCSPIARRAPASCRCPRPISSSSSAHKLGGPPGIGALLVRDSAMLEPIGGQERGYRPGTENLPGDHRLRRGARGRSRLVRASRSGCARGSTTAIVAAGGEVVAGEAPRIADHRLPIGCRACPAPRS